MDNVQKHNTCIDVPSSQTFRSYLLSSDVKNAQIITEVSVVIKVNSIFINYGFHWISKSSRHAPKYLLLFISIKVFNAKKI
jgi:hypothetical protein